MPIKRKIDALKQRSTQVRSDSYEWRQHWKELSDYLAPEAGRYLSADDEKQGRHNQGKKLHSKIINGAAMEAQRIIAAGLQSGLTSPSRPWFMLTTADEQLAEVEAVRLWLHDVRQRMLAVFSGSNFYSAVHSVYEEIPTFGTGAMLIEDDPEQVCRFRPFTIGEFELINDARLRPATMHRKFVYTAAQLVEEFGEENLDNRIITANNHGQSQSRFEVVHILEPNQGPDASEFPYKSYYYLDCGDKFAREAGYYSKPFVAVRWSVVGTDVYGRRCPGMAALGDVKMLQKLEEKKLKALDKNIDPPLNAPAELATKGVNIVPGGVNYYDAMAGRQAVTPVHVPNIDLNAIRQEIRDVETRIKRTYYNDLFLAILADDKRMTATEVARRYEEKLLMIGPVVEKLQSEFLDPTIDRVFQIMQNSGLLPEVPREIIESGSQLRVNYVGILAQAQKIVSTTAVEQVAGFVGNLSAVIPDVVDKFDSDEALDQYADSLGVPPKLIRSDDEVSRIRQQRAAAQQAQQAQEAALNTAQGAKTLSEADTGTNNALTALMGGLA